MAESTLTPRQHARSFAPQTYESASWHRALVLTLWSWVVALFLFGTMPTLAATPNPMSESQAQQLQQGVVRMRDTVQNLAEMAKSARGAEQMALLETAHEGITSMAAPDRFLELAIIYRNMTSEKDKAYVARYASIRLEEAKRILDAGVTGINDQLMYVTSPAAIAEAQQLRDFTREVRQGLEQYHY